MPPEISSFMQKLSAPRVDPRLAGVSDAVFEKIHQRRQQRVLQRQTMALQIVCVGLAFAAGWMHAEASVPASQSLARQVTVAPTLTEQQEQ